MSRLVLIDGIAYCGTLERGLNLFKAAALEHLDYRPVIRKQPDVSPVAFKINGAIHVR